MERMRVSRTPVHTETRIFPARAAQPRIAHPRAGMQRFTPEIAESIIDQGTGRLGCVATAPKGDAEPISEFGPLLARINTTGADQPAIAGDDKTSLPFA